MFNAHTAVFNLKESTHDLSIAVLNQGILDKAKIAYSCRRVKFNSTMTVISGNHIQPSAGDIVLARVDAIGQHKGIESHLGRKANLFPGDEIIVCYGNRYAPDQFEAEVPKDLSPCSLVAAGGMAAQVLSQHASMSKATAITPIGLIGDSQGKPINLYDWALAQQKHSQAKITTIAVVGTSMNAGKTTTAANLIRGLNNAGLKVGAAKITGTGSPNDVGFMMDAGAYPVFDFTDAGHPSTYQLASNQIETILSTLTAHLAAAKVDVIVLEIADGLFQPETEALCLSKLFGEVVDGILFAAGDAMGASFGADWLLKQNLPLWGLGGVFTSSPLAITEATKYLNTPIFKSKDLSSASIVDALGLNQAIRQIA